MPDTRLLCGWAIALALAGCASGGGQQAEPDLRNPLELDKRDMQAAVATLKAALDAQTAKGWPRSIPQEVDGTVKIWAQLRNRTRHITDERYFASEVEDVLVEHPAVSAVDGGGMGAILEVQISAEEGSYEDRQVADYAIAFRLLGTDGTIVLNPIHRLRKVRER